MDHNKCADHERYSEDPELGVAYLDVMPCNDSAAVRTEEVAPGVLVDVRTDADEVSGIELLDLDTPLARWIARAASALRQVATPEIGSGMNISTAKTYITRI